MVNNDRHRQRETRIEKSSGWEWPERVKRDPENSGINPDLQPSITDQAANEDCPVGLVPTMKIFQICIGSGWAATKREKKKKWPQKSIKDKLPSPPLALSLLSSIHHLFSLFCYSAGGFSSPLCVLSFFLLCLFPGQE